MAEKKLKPLVGSTRPAKLPQVNRYLQQHGIEKVRLERGHGYFTFWGMPIDRWLNRVVVVDRLDDLTLQQWLEKYRELEQQNNRANPFEEKKKHKRK